MNKQNVQVAAIVPAFNEEKTIGNVISVLAKSDLLDEIIVISDGSTDNTKQVSEKAGATLVHELPVKNGKGAAMLHGLAHTDASVIVFFDADLRGLTLDHVARLVLPVINGAKTMNIGTRDRGKWISKLAQHLPLIGGERALRRKVLEQIPPEYIQGFMVESALNFYCRSRKLRYSTVMLPGLTIRKKYQKVGVRKALFEYLRMGYQIAKAMMLVRIAYLLKQF